MYILVLFRYICVFSLPFFRLLNQFICVCVCVRLGHPLLPWSTEEELDGGDSSDCERFRILTERERERTWRKHGGRAEEPCHPFLLSLTPLINVALPAVCGRVPQGPCRARGPPGEDLRKTGMETKRKKWKRERERERALECLLSCTPSPKAFIFCLYGDYNVAYLILTDTSVLHHKHTR